MKFIGKAARMIIVLLVCAAAGFHPASSHGYVLPAPYILEQMTAGMGLPNRFQVTQALHVIKGNSENDNESQWADRVIYKQVLRYRQNGMFRSDIADPDLNHTYISLPGKAMTIVDETIVSESESWLYSYGDLFSHDGRKNLSERLKDRGLNVHVSSLGRLGDDICYVIGAQYPDTGTAQLWISRENYMPVRLVVTGAENHSEEPAEEIRFHRWRRFDGMRYPGEIVFLEKGVEVQKLIVTHIDVNPVFELGIFDISHLKAVLQQADKEEDVPDISDEIQQEIEQFKRIFE